MSLFSQLQEFVRAKLSPPNPGFDAIAFDATTGEELGPEGQSGGDTQIIGLLTRGQVYNMWLRNPTVSACVGKIAGAMIRRGGRIVAAKGPDGKPVPNPSPENRARLEEFYNKPHPYMSMDEILGAAAPGLVLASNFFAEVTYSKLAAPTDYGRQPSELWTDVDQSGVRARMRKDGMFDRPAWQINGADSQSKPVRLDWEQLLWLRLPGIAWRGVFPISPVELLQVPISTNNSAKEYIRSFFTHGGKVGLVFTLKDNAPNAAAKAQEWLRFIARKYVPSKSGFRALCLYDGMTVDSAPSGVKDTAVWIDVQAFSRDEICAVFDVDPRLVAADRGGTLGGAGEREQAYKELMENSVLPRARAFGACWTNQVHRQGFGILDWDYELDCVAERSEDSRTKVISIAREAFALKVLDRNSLQDLNAVRAEAYPGLVPYAVLPASAREPKEIFAYDYDAGIVTINEARATKGLPPLPDGDRLIERTPVSAPALPAPSADQPPTQPEGQPAPTPTTEVTERRAPRPTQFVKRFNVRRAVSLLDAYDAKVKALCLELVAKTRDALVPKMVGYYADGDIKAVKKIAIPGGGTTAADGKRLLKAFYTDATAQAADEVAGLAKERGRQYTTRLEGGISAAGKGNVNDYLDLANTRFFDELFVSLDGAVLDTFMEGLAAGWSKKEFSTAIVERFNALESPVDRAVRTQSTEFFGLARQRTFEDAGDLVETVQYSAILDDRTTDVCKALDGVVFRGMSDPNLDTVRPPNHYNCRSTILPVMTGDNWEPTPQNEMRSAIKLISPGFGKRGRYFQERGCCGGQ